MKTKDGPLWVIQNRLTGEFWSNDWGWGSLRGAMATGDTTWNRLPIDGVWVPVARGADEIGELGRISATGSALRLGNVAYPGRRTIIQHIDVESAADGTLILAFHTALGIDGYQAQITMSRAVGIALADAIRATVACKSCREGEHNDCSQPRVQDGHFTMGCCCGEIESGDESGYDVDAPSGIVHTGYGQNSHAPSGN
ncbi:MAG: hypothetical protein ACYDAG_05685 [Chloroflexota bacterium]